jgi:ATP-dependent protease ClpP protease subunit
MADKNTELAELLEKGVDLKNRRIYFGSPDEEGDVSWTTVEYAIRAIHKMSLDQPKVPIELHMSSLGGDVYEMLRLYDVIQSSPCQIKFFGGGNIASAAAFIMMCCDERYLYPNTIVTIHAGSNDYGDKTFTDIQIDHAFYVRLVDRLTDIYVQNSRMPRDFWMEILQRDTHLEPQEVIALGLADAIVEPKKRGNLRKIRATKLKEAPDTKELTKLVKDLYKRIHKGRQLLKIDVHVPQEQFDKNIVVEELVVSSDSSNEEN